MGFLAILTALCPHILEVIGLVTLIPLVQSAASRNDVSIIETAHTPEAISLEMGEWSSPAFDFITWLSVLAFVFTLQMTINVIRCWTANHMAKSAIAQRRTQLLQQLFKQGYGLGISRNKGKILHAFSTEADRMGKGLIGFINLCSGILFYGIVGITLLWWSWSLTLMLLPFALLTLWVMKSCNQAVHISAEECHSAQRESSSSISETLQNLSSIFTTLAQKDRLKNYNEKLCQQTTKEKKHETIYQSTLHLTRYVVFMAVAMLMLFHHLIPFQYQLDSENLIAFLVVISRLQPVASTLSMDMSNIITGSLAQEHLSELENEQNIDHPVFGETTFPESHQIDIRNLSYQHKGGKQVFKSQNLSLEEKTLHVIHGPSGCGKSTLIHILAGLLKPQHGSIEIGNIHMHSLDKKSFYDNVSLVPQEAEFFMTSLRENLCLGLEDVPTDWDILDMADLCECRHIIEEKKEGLDTPMFSLGKNMSGGQKKKLMLLRSILRRPKILLCDEPTAGLDDEASKEMIHLFQNLRRQLTVIVVSHDPVFIQSADRHYSWPQEQ
jgi:ABC-type bacteriocin/lantibiotic exporter with double-glycine peptidase domain